MKYLPKLFLSTLIATALAVLIGCTGAVDSESYSSVYTVDLVTGFTDVDTAALREEMEGYSEQWFDPRDLPPIVRSVEAEELGHESIVHMLNTYDSGIEILEDIADEEKSQAVALQVIIDAMGIDDPHPETDLGNFLDTTVSAVWDNLIADGKHTSAAEAIVAVTKVFEFQLKQALDARASLSTPAAKYAGEVMYGMNRNHFLAMYRYLMQSGVQYEPMYLTPNEFEVEVVWNLVPPPPGS